MWVEQFLESLGHESTAAEHDVHRGALEDRVEGDIVMHGDDRYMTQKSSAVSQQDHQ